MWFPAISIYWTRLMKRDLSRMDIRLLYQFIERLDPLNKALILLYLDEHSYREIAEVLGITETNVATKINRLRNRMKQEFSGAKQA